MEFIYDKIAAILKTNLKTALCTIVSTKGSTPLKAGAKMIVFDDGHIFGTIGGGKLEKATIDDALEVIKLNKAKLQKQDILQRYAMRICFACALTSIYIGY